MKRMRRSLWVFIGGMIGVLTLAAVFQGIDGGPDNVRYHQHEQQPSEEELDVCPVCGGSGTLCTHLPIIQIETGGQKIPGKAISAEDGTLAGYETGDNGETEIRVSYSEISEEGVWHHPEDTPSLQGEAMFRVRGNSSRWFTKSSYRLKLIEEGSPEKNARLGLLGMNPGTEWALYGPFLDKTLMRNYMWMNISAQVMGYAPNVRFCEVLLDGKYQGVYVLMEMVTVQEGRVELTKYRDGDPICSYLVRIEPHTNPEKTLDNFTFYTQRLEPSRRLELVYPGVTQQSQQVRDYVQTDINEIERLLYSAEMAGGSGDWKKELDMDSFVNYYILQEFLAVNDMFTASTYFYRDARGKLCAGPVWDFNNVLDNFFQPMPEKEFLLSQRGWFGQLMQDEDFVEAVIRRYRELREGVLSEEHLLAYEQAVEDWLGSAVERNFQVWGYSFDPDLLAATERRRPDPGDGLTLREVNPDSFEEAVEWMLDYMTDRGRWMDEHIESLRQYCHPSKNAVQTMG